MVEKEGREDVEVLFGLIDVKLVSRVLRMERITKKQTVLV